MPANGIPSNEKRKIFDKFDKNGDGKISYDELRDVILALSPETTSEELDRIIRIVDTNADGQIDFDEFAACLAESDGNGLAAAGGTSRKSDDDLRDAFDLYDLDRDGKISALELHVVLGRLGEKHTMEECVTMVKQVDADGDGYVDYQEFKTMMTSSTFNQNI